VTTRLPLAALLLAAACSHPAASPQAPGAVAALEAQLSGTTGIATALVHYADSSTQQGSVAIEMTVKRGGPLSTEQAVELAERATWHSKVAPLVSIDLLAAYPDDASHAASRFVDVASTGPALTAKYGRR
jgi:hypothetical protein